ncbi:MAG TPA: allophanate hydrolase [Acidimicrobiales bacterium]|nr:allophanate hydrolase [Acidimicrobiales bacterium]
MGDAIAAPLPSADELIRRIDESGRDEVWISRVPISVLGQAIEDLRARLKAGADLPLAGLTFAVKDNIDVAGVPTTAGCPEFSYRPTADAPAVRSLLDAGALLVGKTNLDQFATGLVGTRSPYGAVRNAIATDRISGGSSSGSAVAVALQLVDFALGTDTAGSGRVPAALNGIIGMKPTRGLVSTGGVVPACRSFDCVSVFSPSLSVMERVLAVLAAPDPSDFRRRAIPPTTPLGPPARPTVAYAGSGALVDLDPGRRRCYEDAVQRLRDRGCNAVAIDLDLFLEAGQLLYQGAFLAERYAAVGPWVDAHLDAVDPVVGPMISAAGSIPASTLAADIDRLGQLAAAAEAQLTAVGADSLILPTAPFHPTLAEVAEDPIGVNSRLGRYTTFVNLLGLCAVAVPAGTVEGLPFGVSLIGQAWSELVQIDLARRLERDSSGENAPPSDLLRMAPPCISLVVVGAHLSGQPLNYQLTDRGGRLARTTSTAPLYELYVLETNPPKPGLLRLGADRPGCSIEVEVWDLPPVGFADLVASLPTPMAVGPVTLLDGSTVTGFLCEPVALMGASSITEYGGWRAYLAAREPAPPRH